MSTTVKYKGNTIGTAENSALKLTTSGKWMEDDVTITDVSSTATLQTKSVSYTPTDSSQSETVTPDVGYDGMSQVSVTVNATPLAQFEYGSYQAEFFTENDQRKFRHNSLFDCWEAGWLPVETEVSPWTKYKAIEAGTVITPTTSTQTIGAAKTVLEDAITIDPIPSNYGLITWDGSTLTVS